MASLVLPPLEMTWQFNPNQAITAQGTALATSKRIWRTEKNAMIGFASNPWTVRYSCGGSSPVAGTAGDGVDRWTADADLVWAAAASPHSWIVLRNAHGVEICISCEGASVNGAVRTLVVSPSAGFTGGTASARPTAADEHVKLNNATWGLGTDVSHKLHQWQSQDGKHYAMVLASAGVVVCTIIIGVAKNPVDNWANPYWIHAANGTSALDYSVLNRITLPTITGRAPVGLMTMWFTGEGYGNAIGAQETLLVKRQTGANAISGKFPTPAIGLASETSGAEGRHGEVRDFLWGLTNQAIGLNYPTGGPWTRVQIGSILFPNNNTQYTFT